MPEKDGKSRIFITGGDNAAWLTYPKEEAVSHDNRLTNGPAQEVLKRADYRGVYQHISERDRKGKHGKTIKEGYGFFEKDGTHFDVDLKGITFSEKGDQKLVKTLEERAGKKGLTIVVS